METILVITLGTREIQISKEKINGNFEVISEEKSTYLIHKLDPETKIHLYSSREFPEVYTISPRIDGKTLIDNPGVFDKLLVFPLISPVLEYIKSKKIHITCCMMVFTDQQKAFEEKKIAERNWLNDTLYFYQYLSKIIQKELNIAESVIYSYPIKDQVTNIDDLYLQFDEEKSEIFGWDLEEIEKVYLLPQGGIDQINTALTLKLIEYFRDKVVQLQNAEGATVEERKFPELFLKNLDKHKIIKLLEQYDFKLAMKLLPKKSTEYKLCNYASKRLALSHKNITPNELDSLQKETLSELLVKIPKPTDTNIIRENNYKLKDAFFSAKVFDFQENYGAFVWRLFTIAENIFTIFVDTKIIGYSKTYDYELKKGEINISLEKKIKDYFTKNNYPNNTFLNLRNKKYFNNQYHLDFSNHNRFLSSELFLILVKKGDFGDFIKDNSLMIEKDLIGGLERLNKQRNKISHNLEPVSKEQIGQILSPDTTIENILNAMGLVLNIDDPQSFGDFDIIKNIVIKSL